MFTFLHTGLGTLLTDITQKLNGTSGHLQQAAFTTETLSQADVVLIGPEEEEPVKLVQSIFGLDKHISVIVITHPQRYSRIKQTIQFAPFVGKNTLCIAYSEQLNIEASIKNAALRTKQRRSFSRINKVPGNSTSIASNAVKIENFGTFLEQAPVGALLVDNENRIVAINKKAKSLFDATAEKAYMLNDFFPGTSIQQLKIGPVANDSISKVMETGNRYLEIHLSEVKTDEGKTLHIILTNDITAQKQKESALIESEALFRFMAEAIPQKVWMADDKGHRNFFNQKWTEYTGLSLSELEGWGWTSVVHPDDRDQNIEAWKRSVETGLNFQFENRLLRKDGQYRWHLVRGLARKDSNGKIMMWVGTNTDIHEQKAFADEMERRVKERTFELEKSNSELEQFVYVTSHDLQEPLRKIRMFSEMLKETANETDLVSKKHIDKISATALRMSTLLKELLNFAQLSHQEQFEDTDLNNIVSKALLDLELTISEKKAAIHFSDLPAIQAVPVQMHQLFYNLINNALKFAKADVPPIINIRCGIAHELTLQRFPYLIQDKIYYEIVVEDNGIGFEQHYADQIFHIFQRLHTRAEYSGTGIGLALCKKVVINHYGAIYANAEKGKGAAFHILLPKDINN